MDQPRMYRNHPPGLDSKQAGSVLKVTRATSVPLSLPPSLSHALSLSLALFLSLSLSFTLTHTLVEDTGAEHLGGGLTSILFTTTDFKYSYPLQHIWNSLAACSSWSCRANPHGGCEEGSYLRLIDFCITQLQARRWWWWRRRSFHGDVLGLASTESMQSAESAAP